MADTNKRRSSIWTPTFSASPNARFTFLLLTLEGDRNRECFACDLLLFLAFFALLATVSLRLRVVPAALDDFLPLGVLMAVILRAKDGGTNEASAGSGAISGGGVPAIGDDFLKVIPRNLFINGIPALICGQICCHSWWDCLNYFVHVVKIYLK